MAQSEALQYAGEVKARLRYDPLRLLYEVHNYVLCPLNTGTVSVNSIENFWRHLKCSINGTHTSVSPKYLDLYAKQFEYRFNRRNRPETMFSELVSTFRPLSAA
ncbi:transposase [Qipengyuania marisflavi]|uniref:Transposase n=1 Tax=Qipengyuania marisflavi TaxID=2486356 RepID=A0A5S3P8F9_9SPHN|nr:transposase [Qipengyuania marisflavi]TMM47270.1 transposase [Qipengyuania marisflavi]